ncbi:MAG: hypothetical protein CMI18_03640 [Opitutaceae bacterium]|nr:hypothetical protein [Opitutaceae bacterium]|tara:strand:- start:482 stop:1957 length:1476 start_codon:yes stop_codon:yes gene_type:complete
MNKTLLLIICDFLLLSLLALARFEAPDDEQSEMEVLPKDPMQAQEDIIEVLKLSLEMEEASNENMAASLKETQDSLQQTQDNLQDTQDSLENREEELQLTQEEREALAKAKEQLEATLKERIAVLKRTQEEVEKQNALIEEQRLESEKKLREMTALQKELRDQHKAISEAEMREAELAEARKAAEQQAQTLDTQLQLAEAESRLVRENLEHVKTEISIMRDDNQRLQEHASQLATQLTEGVNAQTERLTQIAEEVRSAQPRNANQIFSDVVGSGVTLEVRFQKLNRRGGNEARVIVRPVVVSDGQALRAVFNWDDLDISENDLRNQSINLRGNIRLGRRTYPLTTFEFLSIDTRILAVPLDNSWVNFIESEPFYIAADPLKFPQAVLVDLRNNGYGDTRFNIDPRTPDYFRIDSRFMNRLMGDFAPRESSVMFSKSGEFLGVMVNKEYAALIDNFVSARTVTLGRSDTLKQFQDAYTLMVNRVRRLPSDAR